MSLIVLPRGGFGNILFNVLIGLSFSKKYNMPVYFISHYQDQRPNIKTYEIFKSLPYLNTHIKIDCTFVDREFGYTDINIIDKTKNYLLNGYFQSYKFSIDYIKDIKTQLFNTVPQIFNNASDIIASASIPSTFVPVCVHVRRGDYLKLQHVHPVQTDEYYNTGMNKILSIEPNAYFLVFSDDIPFVRNWSILKNKKYTIIDSDVETSFIIMSLCKHFIISNSSLSLLAYYFRECQDGKLCIPRKWFASQGPKYDLNDLISDPENTFII